MLEIISTGSYLPVKVIGNDHFAGRDLNIYDENNLIIETKKVTCEGIKTVTGVQTRRMAHEEEYPSDMGYDAARRALDKGGVKASSLQGIIVASLTGERRTPSVAIDIQKKLGVKTRIAFDINNACAGFPMALIIADGLSNKMPGNYLVVATENLTRYLDYTDLNSTLFGDGAGAAVLIPSRDKKKGIISWTSESDSTDGQCDYIFFDKNGFLRMPYGKKVFKEAVTSMNRSVLELKYSSDWEHCMIVPHQANGRILDAIKQKIIDRNVYDKMYNNVYKYGNMSAATCAIALDESRQDHPEEDRVIVTSFGAGLVTTAGAIQF